VRALKIFWVVVLVALGGGAAVLQALGPPERPAVAGASGRPGATGARQGPNVPGSRERAEVADGPAAGADSVAQGAADQHRGAPRGADAGTSAGPDSAPARTAAADPSVPLDVAPGPAPVPSEASVRPAPPSAPEPPPLPRLPDPPAPVADRPIPAPEPALLEASPHGPIPRIGPEGRTAIRAYARAFDRTDTRPRVALVVGNLGLAASLSEEAIRRLPPATALAFSPYALRPEPLLERARARGMEVLSALPSNPRATR
jgi:hypothetical protein